jgi:hypothetical protein
MKGPDSQTICVIHEKDESIDEESKKEPQKTVLRLKMVSGEEPKHVHWDENTLDNEHSGKKKSKGK